MRQCEVNRLATNFKLEVDSVRFGTEPGKSSVKVFRDYDQPRYLEGHICQEGPNDFEVVTAAYEHRRMTPMVEQKAKSLEQAFRLAACQFDVLSGNANASYSVTWSTHQVVRASAWIDAIEAKIAERKRSSGAAFKGGNQAAGRYWSDWCMKAESTIARIQMRLKDA